MSALNNIYPRMKLINGQWIRSVHNIHRSIAKDMISNEEEEFRVLDLRSQTRQPPKEKPPITKRPILPPREGRMPVDQDWASVWPGPRMFHPASVPLPLHQGFYKPNYTRPGKYANAELMKLPNFLHLTPPAIKKHCQALKQFCTPWPKGLETDEQCQKHFPLQVTTTNYCHSSPKIRDPKARVVTFKFPLSALALDKHAKDKILRLLRDRYDENTGMITLTTDRCPLRKQNYDYNMYLVLALYHESWRKEDWEDEKEEADMEYYVWENNLSKRALIQIKMWPTPLSEIDVNSISLEGDENASNIKEAVTTIFEKGDDLHALLKYREATVKFLLGPSVV